jgi:hypothetical protein
VVMDWALAMIIRMIGGMLVMGVRGDRIGDGLRIGTWRGHDTRELGHDEHGHQQMDKARYRPQPIHGPARVGVHKLILSASGLTVNVKPAGRPCSARPRRSGSDRYPTSAISSRTSAWRSSDQT